MIRILIVDDVQALLDVVKYILESNLEFQVDTATSVPEALEYLDQNEYDAIISDYCMPDMNGVDLLKIVRSKNPTIPFVIQTGNGDEYTAMEALQYGADYFLEKGNVGTLQFLAFTQIINLLVSHRRLTSRLENRIQTFESLCHTNRDGLLYINESEKVQEVNDAFLDLTGYSEEEIKNLTYEEIISQSSDDPHATIRDQVLTKGYSDRYQIEYIRSDGEIVPLMIWANRVDHESGEQGMWVNIRDMSRV